MTPAQLTALKSELDTDPQNYGYAEQRVLGADQTMADMLNHVRDGVTAPPAGNTGPVIAGIREDFLMPGDVLEAIDNRDFIASPNPAHVAWFESATQLRSIRLLNADGSQTRALGNINRLLENPGAQGSRARVTALANRNGSRAEQLFGPRTIVTHQDIAASGYARS